MRLIAKDFKKSFPNLQMGVGINGGADRALHVIQMSLELSQSQNPILLSVDIQNAFNSIDRASVANALYNSAHTAPTWR